MFATTKAFLDHFNLKSLEELPALAELREMEPEPLLDPDDAPVPAHLQALADASLGRRKRLASRRKRPASVACWWSWMPWKRAEDRF
jgi:segregation and condensation protein B